MVGDPERQTQESIEDPDGSRVEVIGLEVINSPRPAIPRASRPIGNERTAKLTQALQLHGDAARASTRKLQDAAVGRLMHPSPK
jgi:hypothetical protein